FFATNRRMHGMWQSTAPSRFLDELPEAHVEVTESKGGFGWGGVTSRFDAMESFGSNYQTPGWQRAQANRAKQRDFDENAGNGRGAARPAPAAAQRGGAGGTLDGSRLALRRRRARVPPKIRLRRHRLGRRQQAHRRLRQGGRKTGGRFVCRTRVSSSLPCR